MDIEDEEDALAYAFSWTQGDDVTVTGLAQCVSLLSNVQGDVPQARRLLLAILDYFEDGSDAQ